MRLAHIRSQVPELEPRIDDLYRQFEESDERTSVESFVAWLHENDHIDRRTFRDLHNAADVQFTNMSTLFFEESTLELEGSDPEIAEEETSEPPPRYKMVGKLSEGAMGEIHIAHDTGLMRKVAYKLMRPEIRKHQSLADRFWREAQITAQLEHPAIVPVYDLEMQEDETLAYTMKLIHGKTFGDLIQETQQFYVNGTSPDEGHSLDRRLEFFLRVCEAIAYAHDRGVLHRDLKPENITVGAFGEVYLMDWGIAKRIGDLDDTIETDKIVLRETIAASQTRLGTILGTPAYMSPEQASGESGLDARSDLYAMGLILHELVGLCPAHPPVDVSVVLARASNGMTDPLVPFSGAPPCAPELVAIVERATEYELEDRYPNVTALAEDVRRYLHNDEVSAYPDRGIRKVYRWIRRNESSVLVALMLLGASTSVALLGGAFWTIQTDRMASARGAQHTALLSLVSSQAHHVDADLLRYQGLLNVLASNAVEALSRPREHIGPEGYSYYLQYPFEPRDLIHSPRYGRKVSLQHPNVVIAGRSEPKDQEQELDVMHLALLKQPLERLLLQSESESAVGLSYNDRDNLLLQQGTPVAFAYVALESGITTSYPGHGDLPDQWDARDLPWYQNASDGTREPRWSHPHVDRGELGLMLPCSMGLYDDDGRFTGVAGIDLTFDHLIENMLVIDGLADIGESFVINEHGEVVIRSTEANKTFHDSARGKPLNRLARFTYRDAAEKMRAQPSGLLEVETPKGDPILLAYSHMDSIGWTYLVAVEESVLPPASVLLSSSKSP